MITPIVELRNHAAVEDAFQTWQIGYRLSEAGKPITECANRVERRGWRDQQIASVGSSLYHLGVSSDVIDAILVIV